MDTLLQQIVNGLALGGVYALVALGYTMVYGILGLINFAHGEVMMIGALVTYSASLLIIQIFPELSGIWVLCLALLMAIPIAMLLAYGIERIAYRPLRHAPKLSPLITAIGISIVLQTMAMSIWGRNYQIFPSLLPTDPITLFQFSNTHQAESNPSVTATPVQLMIIGGSFFIMLILSLIINRTQLGRAMRAASENPNAAKLMGINDNKIIAITFMIGAAMAAIAGAMIAANYGVAHFYMGFLPGLKAFTAAVLGGIGNIYGAMLGGLLLGVVESLGAGYLGDLTNDILGSHYQDIIAFIVLIAVLTLRPSGLLGEKLADRA
jgi:branched-chain amino acid transport system permease protein